MAATIAFGWWVGGSSVIPPLKKRISRSSGRVRFICKAAKIGSYAKTAVSMGMSDTCFAVGSRINAFVIPCRPLSKRSTRIGRSSASSFSSRTIVGKAMTSPSAIRHVKDKPFNHETSVLPIIFPECDLHLLPHLCDHILTQETELVVKVHSNTVVLVCRILKPTAWSEEGFL